MTGVRPLLYKSLEPMISGEPPLGAYDASRHVWIAQIEGKSIPLAHAAGSILEIQTKTKVLQESDDEIPGMLEMMTKTFVAVERNEDDDDQMLAAA